jgi:hypothetical protein
VTSIKQRIESEGERERSSSLSVGGGACLGGVADLVAEAARGHHRTDRTKQCQWVQGKPRTSNWWRPTGAAPEHGGSRAGTLAAGGSGARIGGDPGQSE